MNAPVELIADYNNVCGEGPIWDFRNTSLLWVDQDNPGLFRFNPSVGSVEVLDRKTQITGIGLNADGGYVAAGHRGLFLWRDSDTQYSIVTEHERQPLVLNDIVAGPDGRIYGGTVYWDDSGMQKTGCLYRFENDGSVSAEDEGILLSNGLAFSPDDSTLYLSDSGARTIFCYDCRPVTGELTNKRSLTTFLPEEGIPDGITVDSEGYIWCALWYGGKVVRLDPDGLRNLEISLPVRQVSSVMFGSEDMHDLYITSAGEYWPSRLQPPGFDTSMPMGGALYRVRVDVAGRPEHVAAFEVPE